MRTNYKNQIGHTCLSVHSSTVPEVVGGTGISTVAVTLIKRSTSSLIALAHKRGRSRSTHTRIDIYIGAITEVGSWNLNSSWSFLCCRRLIST